MAANGQLAADDDHSAVVASVQSHTTALVVVWSRLPKSRRLAEAAVWLPLSSQSITELMALALSLPPFTHTKAD